MYLIVHLQQILHQLGILQLNFSFIVPPNTKVLLCVFVYIELHWFPLISVVTWLEVSVFFWIACTVLCKRSDLHKHSYLHVLPDLVFVISCWLNVWWCQYSGSIFRLVCCCEVNPFGNILWEFCNASFAVLIHYCASSIVCEFLLLLQSIDTICHLQGARSASESQSSCTARSWTKGASSAAGSLRHVHVWSNFA